MNAIERDRVLTVRLTAEEREMLRAVSERNGVDASTWVRLAIRAERRTFSTSLPSDPAVVERKRPRARARCRGHGPNHQE